VAQKENIRSKHKQALPSAAQQMKMSAAWSEYGV
jgi:hypothetical protein